ncbi:MAG: DUF2339 domain-containing protein, partial [Oscillospiraceae bacterium]|nr:DUF2339 domain-containing protein [Oscillospiraceae bacterium]
SQKRQDKLYRQPKEEYAGAEKPAEEFFEAEQPESGKLPVIPPAPSRFIPSAPPPFIEKLPPIPVRPSMPARAPQQDMVVSREDYLERIRREQAEQAAAADEAQRQAAEKASREAYLERLRQEAQLEPAAQPLPAASVTPASQTPLASDPVKEVEKPEAERQPAVAPTTAENMLGRNVLGIAASVLIFVGLIFLGRLIYDNLTDGIKVALMFVISAVITGLGVILCRKARNPFTLILTGCGCGSFFISILLTHIYFNMIRSTIAYALLLVWMVAVLYLAKRLQSVSISVVAHIGMALSICFAFMPNVEEKKLITVLIYQMISSVVISWGNILCCKKTYKFGLFISLALTLVAGGFMWFRFQPQYFPEYLPFGTTALPRALIAGAFAAQFVCASFLSYLLAVSANRLEKSDWRIAVHIANKALWVAALFLNVYWLTYRLVRIPVYSYTADQGNLLSAIWAAVLAGLGMVLLHAVLTVFMKRRWHFDEKLETVSALINSGVLFVLMSILLGYRLLENAASPVLFGLLLPAAALALAGRASRNRIYGITANVFTAVDLLFMLFYGYRELGDVGTVALPAGYMLIYLGILWYQWLRRNKIQRETYNGHIRLASYLIAEASLAIILLTSSLRHKEIILLITMATLNLLLLIFKYDRRGGAFKPLYIAMRLNELFWIAVGAGHIAFAWKDDTNSFLYLLLIGTAAALALIRIKENLLDRAGGIRRREEALYIAKIAAIVMAVVWWQTELSPYQPEWLLLTVTALGIAFYYLRYYLYRYHRRSLTAPQGGIDPVMRVAGTTVVFFDSLFIAFASSYHTNNTLRLLIIFAAAALAFTRIKGYLLSRESGIRQGQEALYILKIAALVMAVVCWRTEDSLYQNEWLLLAATALGIAFYYLRHYLYRYHGRSLTAPQGGIDPVMRVAGTVLVFFDSLFIKNFAHYSANKIPYLLITCAAAVLAFTRIKGYLLNRESGIRQGQEALYILKISGLVMAVVWWQTEFSPHKTEWLLLAATVLGIAFYWLRYTLYRYHRRAHTAGSVDLPMRIAGIVLVAINSLFIAFAGKGGRSNLLCLLIICAAAMLALIRIKENLLDRESGFRQGDEALYIAKITALVMAFVCWQTENSRYQTAWLLLASTTLGIAFYLLRYYLYRYHRASKSLVDPFMWFIETALVAADTYCIAFITKDRVSNTLFLLLAALAAGLAFIRVKRIFTSGCGRWEEMLTGIKLTGLTMATVYGHTTWFDNAYIVSLVCMLTALACIITGFIARAKYIRLYGLVLTLMCVIKLVTYDVAELDDALRVVSLIIGGAICFGISAIYSYSVKRVGDRS